MKSADGPSGCLEDLTVQRRLLQESYPGPAVSTCTEDAATNIFLSRAAPRSPKVGSWMVGEGTF